MLPLPTLRTKSVEKDEVHGLIHSRDFGGTKKWRTCFTADATGHTMLFAVANEALKHNIEIHNFLVAFNINLSTPDVAPH